MNMRAVTLLQAASEVAGGDKALARHLSISEALLVRFMSGRHELPETVLFGAVDLILANQNSRPYPPS